MFAYNTRKITISTYLARKGLEQWEENNPKLFTEWVHEKLRRHDEQFRSVVKYIKKWAYYKGYEEISGFLTTILVGNNFSGDTNREDRSLLNTLDRVVNDLEGNKAIFRPVSPEKNMTDKYTESEFRQLFIDRFKKFRDKAEKAFVEDDHGKSCDIWRELFGDEFPEADEEERDKIQERQPVKITTETRPWGN